MAMERTQEENSAWPLRNSLLAMSSMLEAYQHTIQHNNRKCKKEQQHKAHKGLAGVEGAVTTLERGSGCVERHTLLHQTDSRHRGRPG